MQNWTRREFIKTSSVAAAGLAVGGSLISCGKQPVIDPHKVVLIRDPMATGDEWSVNANAVQGMMDTAITELAGIDDVGRAWKSFFPGINSRSVIGLKPNCVVADSHPGQLVTHPEVSDAIVQGLLRMPVRGFGPENVLIWERWTAELDGAGYTINKGSEGVRCYGTGEAHEVDLDEDAGYDKDCPFTSLEDTAYFSKIVSQQCDYLINVPVLKQCGVAITFALKNNYGAFSSDHPIWGSIGEVWHKEFAQRIIDINSAPPLRDKYKLVVGDALFGLKEGGPAGPPQFTYNGLILSADPVAADAVGMSILEEEGVDISRGDYIHKAADAGLGVAKPEQIHRVYLNAESVQA
jgi:uncharacterized protein (DUF362 family)